MKSLRIIFDSGSPRLDTGNWIRALDNEAQTALVNIATDRGSDLFLPERGTTLLATGLQNGLFDFSAASAAGAIASTQVVDFLRTWTWGDSPDLLRDLRLVLRSRGDRDVEFSLALLAEDGRTLEMPLGTTNDL